MSDTNDDFDFDALLDATEAAQKPEGAPAPATPSLPPAETDDLPDLQAVPQVAASTTMAPPPDGGDDPNTFMASTGIQVQREVPDITKPWMKHHTFKLVSSIDELEKLIDECIAAGRCSLDLETQGLDSRSERDENGKLRTVHQIVGFCISPGNAKFGYYAPVRHRPNDGGPDLNLPVAEAEAAISRLCWASQPVAADGQSDILSFREFKQKPRVIIDFWNAKFDQEFLYPVTGIDWWHPDSFEDGLLACFVLKSEDKGLGLKYKAPELLRDPDGNPYEMIKLKELFPNGRKIQFDALAPDEPGVVKYACSDAVCTRLLCDHPEVVGRVKDPSRARDLGFIYRLEKQCVQAVRVMERNRVRVDRDKFRQLLEVHLRKREEIRAQIVELAESKGFHGFEPGQTTVLSEFLFGERGLDIKPKPEKNEASGQYKTDASSIEQLVQEIGEEHAPAILKWIIEWREQDKVIGTYLEKLVANPDKNSELRFGFKETGAATGRFSAPQGEADQGFSAVPIHGIPSTSALREGFIAREGYTLVKSDYAGQELRIAANVSGEMVWVKEFLEGDGDLHSITARAFFNVEKPTKEQRKMGKIANFALIYGGGPAAIMRATGCDKVEASRRKQAFDKAVPTFAKWIKGQHATVRKHKGVWTAFGRWIAIPDIDHPEKGVQAACERHSTNYPIQGCLQYASKVLTGDGWLSIGDLATSNKAFLAWTGSKWAVATAHPMGQCRLGEVTLSDGTSIACDTRHKLMIVTDEGQQWVDFDQLEPGMQVATALCEPLEFETKPLPAFYDHKHASNYFQFGPQLEEEFWYWMGRYVGDGCIDPRGGIRFIFGVHEQADVDACARFWTQAGLNPSWQIVKHTPRGQEAQRVVLDIWSVNLIRWLSEIGFDRATAHTKRLKGRILSERLVNRKSFLRGVMDSDGHKPPLVSAKGNPYNIHLCQRPLLEDLKLLFRSVGVESCIRGPYQYHDEVTGKDSTSYRLDIHRRMFEHHVEGRTDLRHPKFLDMFAPQFLVNELLAAGQWRRSDFPDESSYNLYLRLRTGGKVTVYTLKRLCAILGVTLPSPIYGHKKLMGKVEKDQEEVTYTLSVQDPLHRFEADGVITKNSGADIMKIALVLCHKEWHKRGWLKNGGDDSVRMLLTVHDEIVFEIRNDRIEEALPLICQIMSSPWKFPGPPFSPRWQVPLIVEPLLGLSWGGVYNWDMMTEGKKQPPKEGEKLEPHEIRVGDKVYHRVPPWLEGHVKPGWERHGHEAVPTPTTTSSQAPAAVPVEAATPAAAASKTARAPVTPQISDTPAPRPSSPPAAGKVTTFAINKLSKHTVHIISVLCMKARDVDRGTVLRLVDPSGSILVDPAMGIRINPEKFKEYILEHTLGDGSYFID